MFSSFDRADDTSILGTGALFRDSPRPFDSATDDDDHRGSTDSMASVKNENSQRPAATMYATRSTNKKKKGSSMPERPVPAAQQSSASSKGKGRSSRTSTGPSNADEDEHQSLSPPSGSKGKGKAGSHPPLPGFTSVENDDASHHPLCLQITPTLPNFRVPDADVLRSIASGSRLPGEKAPHQLTSGNAISDAQHGYSRNSSGDQNLHATGSGSLEANDRDSQA
ncbi:hypothetical protein L202_01357 [Cryptococcus amylolentus CBS 6039]|uniref:Uncharacterized protein n=2 Tax=Cryptococcus amylolentus TaxID=104669 RepID=A0A1E3I3C8_9TREE|nr:hypothetical protein L202_01357 [Cryptococcus amylolentus CBS 6039]ODN83160.1 hypothetical protein L202_01357 [Cryptococcus amylolentus CBS 6039]ODO10747.1 hypothetical protein I350_01344 [Cryptococcus amylolentus CBS 6273]